MVLQIFADFADFRRFLQILADFIRFDTTVASPAIALIAIVFVCVSGMFLFGIRKILLVICLFAVGLSTLTQNLRNPRNLRN